MFSRMNRTEAINAMQPEQGIIVLGKFEAPGVYGAMYLAISSADIQPLVIVRRADKLEVNNSIEELDIGEAPETFKNKLLYLHAATKQEGRDMSISDNMEKHFRNGISPGKIGKINKLVKTSRDDFLRKILVRDILIAEISEVLNESEVHLEIGLENQWPDGAGTCTEKEGDTESAEAELSAGKTDTGTTGVEREVVMVHPVIAPVGGMTASALAVGMLLRVHVASESAFMAVWKLAGREHDVEPGRQALRVRIDRLEISESPELGEIRVRGCSTLGNRELRFECSGRLQVRAEREEADLISSVAESDDPDGLEGAGQNLEEQGMVGFLVTAAIIFLLIIAAGLIVSLLG